MSDIAVLSRTQVIEVEPMSGTVSVVNAGPQGPAGPGGSLTTEQAVDAAAAALVGANNIVITYNDVADEIEVKDDQGIVNHDWSESGWTPFTERLINDDTGGVHTSQTLSVVNNRGRITNSGPQGNLRKAYLHQDTEWMDSEITSLIFGANVFSSTGTNPATPQGGHVHRGYVDGTGIWRAVVVSNNIFASDVNVVNANVWNSDLTQVPASQLDLGSNGGSKTYAASDLARVAQVNAVRRVVFGISNNEYIVSPADAHGLEVGTEVTVDVVLDNTFDVATATAVTGIEVGMVRIPDAEAGPNVTAKYESGTISPTSASARLWWPYWFKSKLIGSKLSVKVWRYRDKEPDWGDSRFVNNYDFAGAQNPAPNALYPSDPGLCGVLGCHIRNTRFFEYGQWSARRL